MAHKKDDPMCKGAREGYCDVCGDYDLVLSHCETYGTDKCGRCRKKNVHVESPTGGE